MLNRKSTFKLSTCLIAASAALALAAPGGPGHPQRGPRARQNSAQVQSDVGRALPNAFSQSVWDRMNANQNPRLADRLDRVVYWHSNLLDSVAIDHTPDFDTGVVPFIQGGPTRTSRALAMTQIAVFDALCAFTDRYACYNDIGKFRPAKASRDAAIAYAAHTVLVELFPNQQNRLDVLLGADIQQLTDSPAKINAGREVGELAAQAILDRRDDDNSSDLEPNFGEGGRVADGTTTFFNTPVNGGTTLVGEWEPDPNTPDFSMDFNLSLGAFWGGVTPFALQNGDQFRIAPPPLPGTRAYTRAFDQVAARGGSPENADTPSTGTNRTRFIGNFWGYDAVPLLGTPPRLYNQIAIQFALSRGVTSPIRTAQLLARVNTALADAGIAAWDSKWFYNYWRPVTGIRRDDGSPDTTNDAEWDPVGVSIVNVELPAGEDFIRPTPPFPAYPSGHATFGAAVFEVLRDRFGDNKPFTFISDEYNGQGVDPADPSVPRPLVPVRFENFTDAQEENGISRIFNGVHWRFDNIEGQRLGVEISRYLLDEVDAFQRIDD